MKMLREWNGNSLQPVAELIEQFGVSSKDLRLLKYERLGPDSSIWVVVSNTGRFCVYVEDFVDSLDSVTQEMEKHGVINGENDEYVLVKIKNPGKWHESSPVANSDTYTPPKNPDEFMKFSTTSGHDFVFLGESVNNKP